MLFNSYIFIFIFLPATVAGYYLFGNRMNGKLTLSWLVFTSLIFYSWWNPIFILLLIGSILFNYYIGYSILNNYRGKGKCFLIFGITTNLLIIAYFKYSLFIVNNLQSIIQIPYDFSNIILPLGISFFTFQQIAYLVDCYQNKTCKHDIQQYILFVSFFPQLIAGPIVQQKEMLPQFRDKIQGLASENLVKGITVFTIGLFKKVIIADSLALIANPVFSMASQGISPVFIEAWIACLAFTFQLYFDFSGYSDMAIGLGNIFGIKLPQNFNSPYKASNMIDFWKRWHITLSRFLKNYLYIPLGGNRKSQPRTYLNIFMTMGLGGLWHGAGWMFIVWGVMHSFYVLLNHLWIKYKIAFHLNLSSNLIWHKISVLITFVAVSISWVIFRADSMSSASVILRALIFPDFSKLPDLSVLSKILVCFLLVWAFPNTQQFTGKFQTTVGVVKNFKQNNSFKQLLWNPSLSWAFVLGLLMGINIIFLLQESEFLYFQF